jgi:hypothetical protein
MFSIEVFHYPTLSQKKRVNKFEKWKKNPSMVLLLLSLTTKTGNKPQSK